MKPSNEYEKLINELTEEEVDNLPIDKFKSMKDTLAFLHDGKIEGKLKSIIKANGIKYQMSLDAFKITYGQYVDLTSFMSADGGLIGNLHLIMASLAKPVKRNWLGIPYVDAYGSKAHNEVAKDMLKANFADCYSTCIFFCKLIYGKFCIICTRKNIRTRMYNNLSRNRKQTKHGIFERV